MTVRRRTPPVPAPSRVSDPARREASRKSMDDAFPVHSFPPLTLDEVGPPARDGSSAMVMSGTPVAARVPAARRQSGADDASAMAG